MLSHAISTQRGIQLFTVIHTFSGKKIALRYIISQMTYIDVICKTAAELWFGSVGRNCCFVETHALPMLLASTCCLFIAPVVQNWIQGEHLGMDKVALQGSLGTSTHPLLNHFAEVPSLCPTSTLIMHLLDVIPFNCGFTVVKRDAVRILSCNKITLTLNTGNPLVYKECCFHMKKMYVILCFNEV